MEVAHAAAHFLDGFVVVLFQPATQPGDERADVRRAVFKQAGNHLHDARSAHDGLDDVLHRLHAAANGDVGFQTSVEDRCPTQAQSKFRGV